MKVFIVTGTPGAGKTTLSVKLAKKLNFYYIDVNEIVRNHKLSEKYDRKRKTKVIDVRKLNKALIEEINAIKKISMKNLNEKINPGKNKLIKNKKSKKNIEKIKNGIIIDSHLSHYLPRKYVDLCIVAKCNLKELKKRLKKKKYTEDKVRENLDAEIFDICLNEAKENKHKVVVVNTTKAINIKKILNKIKSLIK